MFGKEYQKAKEKALKAHLIEMEEFEINHAPIIKKEKVMKFYIAGVKFHSYRDVLNDVTEGDNLVLVPEPTNKFDPNAVQIHFDNGGVAAFIGFVPKKFSSEVSALMEVGKSLECILTKFTKTASTWEMFEVEIKEIEDE